MKRFALIVLLGVVIAPPALGGPALLDRPANMPTERPITPAVIKMLAEGKVSMAARRLLMEPASTKSLYLIREMQRVGEHETKLTRLKKDDHRAHLNLGIAYHNLFLFLRRHDMTHRRFARRALRLYGKAARVGEGLHRDEAYLLQASLHAAEGNKSRAMRLVHERVDLKLLGLTTRGASYIAGYYAAIGEPKSAVAALRLAAGHDQGGTLNRWLLISDDFENIKKTDEFQAFTADLPKKRSKRRRRVRRK
jgi:hypothetical protein